MTFEAAVKILQPLTIKEEAILWDWARGERPMDQREKAVRKRLKTRLARHVNELHPTAPEL